MDGSIVELTAMAALSLPMTLIVLMHVLLAESAKSAVKLLEKRRKHRK